MCLRARNFLSRCDYEVLLLLYAQPHPEDIVPNTTQKASNVASGVRAPPSSVESAQSVPDEYSRDA